MKYGRDPRSPPSGGGAGSTNKYSRGPSAALHTPPRTSFQDKSMKGLILAQSERWRRGLGMQVERETGGNSGSKAAKG